MNEQEIIAQLKTLRSIRPDQEWVFSTKTQILSESQSHREGFSVGAWLRNPGFLVLPGLVGILLLGIFFYNNHLA